MTYIKLGGVRAFPDAQSTKERNRKRGGAMADRRCADCIHMAPWPERVEQLGRMTEAAPFYPLNACMADGCKVTAVAPAFSPDNEGCIAYGCPSFERGDRSEHYKEV